MTPQDLIGAFDTLAEAPDGVTRLRELVLQLAVRGQLVPQDPDDEPASVLLERIGAEKAALPSDKRRRKEKPLAALEQADEPFEAPEGWTWARLGVLAFVERGGSPRPIKSYLTNDRDGLNWIKIGDTEKGSKYITGTKQRIRPEGLAKTRKVYPGDFLLTNSMSFGRPYITSIEGCIHDGWLRIQTPSSLDKDYLYLLLSSPYVVAQFKEAAAGAVVLNLNADKVRELPLALPPLAEQKRIVARVDELMGLLDTLEAKRGEREATRVALRDAALAALRDADTPEEVEAAWARIAGRMDDLFTDPADVEPLRQTVLQLAVRGRLVPQGPADEPASALLARIAAEKARLVKEKKIRKPKALPPVSVDEVPFEVPAGWVWVRFADIFLDLRYGTAQKCYPESTAGHPVLRIPNLDLAKGTVDMAGMKYGALSEAEKEKWRLTAGELLMIRSNGSTSLVGRAVVVPEEAESCAFAGYLMRLRLPPAILPEYVRVTLEAAFTRQQIEVPIRTTTGVKNVNSTEIGRLMIPVPPRAEQGRIVAVTDNLTELLDSLVRCTTDKKAAHDAFAAAAVHHLDA